MRDIESVIQDILNALRQERVAQVPRHVPFQYVRQTAQAVILRRRNGNDTRVPFSVVGKAIDAIRKDNSVYIDGPGRLHDVGITHINSPTFALVRLVPLNKLID